MELQTIRDAEGNEAGVFIPKEDWALIKANYPGIDALDSSIPDWQKEILDERLLAIERNPERIKSIDDFFED